MSSLKAFLNQNVKVITSDGRLFLGTLEGFDQTTNVVLSNALERAFYPDEPKRDLELGAFIIRGDNVVCLGPYDEDEENNIDYSTVFADKLKSTKNAL
ncbi:unnamed protein product [Ambrosiozyma monospora]|uniref:LSM2-LSM8 complex subunit LSM8 n=1 Tax=Ambrosiozyma monospora TaxID=43982 RepID=A0A9W7DGZ9_AMBMO|nr:unnamed protein product [Ambrosiozyma monospora]